MKAYSYGTLQCECGNFLMRGRLSDGESHVLHCGNSLCKNSGKRFADYTVELKELPKKRK